MKFGGAHEVAAERGGDGASVPALQAPNTVAAVLALSERYNVPALVLAELCATAIRESGSEMVRVMREGVRK